MAFANGDLPEMLGSCAWSHSSISSKIGFALACRMAARSSGAMPLICFATAEVCRKHGLSQGTFYKYKSQYGGMEVSDVAKLRAMEDENARLKRLLADTMLDNAVLKDLLGKN